MTPQKTSSSRLMKVTMIVSAGLALLGGVFFFMASQKKQTGPDIITHKVTVSKTACDPAQLTVPAGQNHFEITNTSDRPVEWEILDGVLVVEERENIAPGFFTSFTTRLKPGTYAITCGLLTNPRGTLIVTPSTTATPKTALQPRAFLGPLAEYKLRLMMGSSQMVKQAATLQQAVDRNDLTQARQDYVDLRHSYKKIETVMNSFADLESAIDPSATYLEDGNQDKAFTGFHAVEFALYSKQSTADLHLTVSELTRNLQELQNRIKTTNFTPADILGQSAKEARRLSANIELGESPYAQFDGWELSLAVLALQNNSRLLQPLLQETDPSLARKIESDFTILNKQLDRFTSGPDGNTQQAPLDRDEKADIQKKLMNLASDLEQANVMLGVE